jgi:hypothetical protein
MGVIKMLNAEKYKDRILEVASNHKVFGIDTKTNKIDDCSSTSCRDCLFYTFGTISEHDVNRIKWLLSEYKEPIKLTRLEYENLKYVQKEGFNFITRNNYGDLYIHEAKPIKPDGSIDWCTTGKSYELCAFNDLFQLVKFEDKDPTSIQDVLKNCEVIDDDL